MRSSQPCSSLDVGSIGIGSSKSNVRRDAVIEEECLFEHDSDRSAKILEPKISNVGVVDADRPGVDVVEACKQAHESRLPRTGGTHDGDRRTRLDDQVEITDDRFITSGKCERDVVESNTTESLSVRITLRKGFGVDGIDDLVSCRQHLLHPRQCHRCPLRQGNRHRQVPQWPDQHRDVCVELDEITHTHFSGHDSMATDSEDCNQTESRKQIESRKKRAANPRGLHRHRTDVVGLFANLGPLNTLCPESFDDSDP